MNAMTYVKSFGRFWYDFIVGDDWRIAVGIALIMIGAWIAETAGLPVWWLFPIAIAGLLYVTVKRAAHD
jgi:hypothetical protein